ncbi:uncharacterized protein LOC123319050 isoform X2 [Coccinella septempunctata]|uniref:uncharacterized protein LOC123319050 isoform X2 n=1 Tax=Coccinella septempunctata TaxID=41139 RepID=UPI001D08226F|nr:uncharacterized protein LOC123319050 isoform X2 [Coccinella septempunctata]
MIIVQIFLYVILQELCGVTCAIIDPPTKHPINNVINKDKKNTSIIEIPIDDRAEIVAFQGGQDESTVKYMGQQESSKITKLPEKMTISAPYRKKMLTSIIHPLPRTMHDIMPRESAHPPHLDHKKVHDDFLKHEGPKLRKKLHHHYTVEEIRQRRRELKEEWRARHNKLSQATPHGLHNKHGYDLKVESKHLLPNAQQVARTKETINRNESSEDSNPNKKNFAHMYDQGTPRTRRILEHREPQTLSAENGDETFQSSQNNKLKAFRMNNGRNSEIKSDVPVHSEDNLDISAGAKVLMTRSSSGDDEKRRNVYNKLDLSSANIDIVKKESGGISPEPENSNPPTENVLESPNEMVSFSGITIGRKRSKVYRSVARKTTTESPSPVVDDVVSVKIDTSKTNEQEVYTIRIDTPPFYRNLTPEEKFLYQKPIFTYGKSAEQVGSIDIHPGLENEQVTIKIDEPPYYRNLTHEEKILIQRPLFGLGKSAEQVGSIDIHPGLENEQVTIKIDTPPYYRNLTHEEKILIQRPLWGLGKSAEQVGSIDIHPGLENEQVTIKIDEPPYYRNLTHEEKILIQRPLWGLGKSAEQVGSIDIHPGLENEQVTIKIDTPPYYRNLTHEEKILIQRPLFGLGKSAEQVGSIDIHPGLENEQVTIKIDTPPYYRNLTHEEKILLQRPLFGLGKSAEQVGSIDIHPGLENEQVTIKIDTPPYYRNLTHEEKILIQRPLFGLGKSAEQVGSIDIHPGLENEQVTIKIDTPPYYRNLTHEEKILIQRPLFGLGKSAEQVGSIDIHPGLENEQVTIKIDTPPYYRNLTYEEKILIQRPLWGLGKSAEQVDSLESYQDIGNEQVTMRINIPAKKTIPNQREIFTDKSQGGLGKPDGKQVFKNEKLLEDPVQLEEESQWKENLKRAVKSRLRKLRRDSGELME